MFFGKKREEINYWGRHIFILFAWGGYICIEAATRDNFHSNKQDIFDCIIKKMEEEQIKKYEELKVPKRLLKCLSLYQNTWQGE